MNIEHTCAQCGATVTNNGQPCSGCGSLERRLRIERVSGAIQESLPALGGPDAGTVVELQPARAEVTAQPLSLQVRHEVEVFIGPLVETLPMAVRIVEVTGPSEPGGSYNVKVWDRDMTVMMDISEQKTIGSALHSVKDKFLPTDDD